MSLKVWLPLNGDLRNNGLYDITVTNDGATVDNNGKIGKCYSFNNTHIIIDSTDLQNLFSSNTQPFSFATWIYLNSDETDRVIIFGNYNANPFVNWELASDGKQILSAGGTSNYIARYSSTNVPKTTWTHIACTYDGSTTTFYMNGVKTNSVNVVYPITSKLGSNRFYLGSDNRNDATRLKGKLNDFRLYDHVLSPKEVKMISQGMILHYPLSREGFGADNLLKYSQVSEANKQLLKTSVYAGWNNLTITNIDGYDAYTYPAANTSTWFYSGNWFSPLSANTTYTYSAWIYFTASSNTAFNFTSLGHFQVYNSASTKSDKSHEDVVASRIYEPATIPPNKWTKIRITFTTNELNGSLFTVYPRYSVAANVGTLYFRDMKLELGGNVTPWVPNQSDELYHAMGLDDGIVYDVSGYGHNGMKVLSDGSTGSFEYVAETPKYSTGMHIHSLNSSTNAQAGTAYINGSCMLNNPSQLSISFWEKAGVGYGGGTAHGAFCTTGNGGYGTDYLTSAMNHRDAGIDINNSEGNAHLRLSISFIANEWHHYTFTYDGQYARSYRDGILQDTKNFSSTMTLGSFSNVFIGLSRAGGVWRRNDSYYSDFRIYATCLSASDIQQLYNTPISLANNGTLFANELTEV